MISKELYEAIYDSRPSNKDRYEGFLSNPPNIYEVGHMCKVWAYEANPIRYSLIEKVGSVEVYGTTTLYVADVLGEPYDVKNVYKACEWILEKC